jgi:hypothetical protein
VGTNAVDVPAGSTEAVAAPIAAAVDVPRIRRRLQISEVMTPV